MPTFPFNSAHPVPVSMAVSEATAFVAARPGERFCLYLADKDEDAWARSTSRVYMNELWPSLIYLPLNIAANDLGELHRAYTFAEQAAAVIGINHTHPHKSNPVLIRRYGKATADFLVRTPDGLQPSDLGGPAFSGWLSSLLSPAELAAAAVVIVGVGGIGTPIARSLSGAVRSLTLIEPGDRSGLVTELCPTQPGLDWCRAIADLVALPSSPLLVINASGKEGTDLAGLDRILASGCPDDRFLDLRPQISLATVDAARAAGWQADGGEGMNLRNDYAMVAALAASAGLPKIGFTHFAELVHRAS